MTKKAKTRSTIWVVHRLDTARAFDEYGYLDDEANIISEPVFWAPSYEEAEAAAAVLHRDRGGRYGVSSVDPVDDDRVAQAAAAASILGACEVLWHRKVKRDRRADEVAAYRAYVAPGRTPPKTCATCAFLDRGRCLVHDEPRELGDRCDRGEWA